MMKHNYLKALRENVQVEIFIQISKILFPRYPCAFSLYMFLVFYGIRCRERLYSLSIISTEVIYQLSESLKENIIDDNYFVIVNNKYMKGAVYGILRVKYEKKEMNRYVKIAVSQAVNENTIGISPSLMCSISNSLEINFVNLNIAKLRAEIKCLQGVTIGFAGEVHLSLINSTSDLEYKEIDVIVENYFKKPKILHECDIIEINVEKYCEDYPLNLSDITMYSKTIYFKCRMIHPKVVQRSRGINGYFVVLGETTVKQTNNLQSFIPSYAEMCPKLNSCDIKEAIGEKPIEICPYGLEYYAALLDLTIRPFLEGRYPISPAFLLVGEKGSGKEILISSIASKYGMQFYKMKNFDINSQLYIQNKAKIEKVFVSAKLCAPCIVYFENFENFEKNNEGQSDDRIISNFSSGLKYLFRKNEYPVILFCSSNNEKISAKLKRHFIEIFKINSLTEQERTRNLQWLMKYKNVAYGGDMKELACKTHTFSFEDLNALVQKAISLNLSCNQPFVLDIKSFSSALDYMQLQTSDDTCTPKVPKVQWDDIGGLIEVKKEIIETINFPLKYPDLFSSSGLRRFGILLFGPPGTGKTLLAKAVCTECNLRFLAVKGPELLNMYIGQSEENIRQVFERARAAAPCIIFFDELDSLAPNRGVSGDSGGVMDRVVSQLLTELDGLNEKATVFIIGATNRPDLIDPALLRPGRFDRLLYVGPSMDFTARLSVLKAVTRKFHFADDVSLEEIIKTCPVNVSGADIYGICAKTWTHAIRRFIQENEDGAKDFMNVTASDVRVKYEDFKSALTSVQPSIITKDLTYFEKLKKEIGSNI